MQLLKLTSHIARLVLSLAVVSLCGKAGAEPHPKLDLSAGEIDGKVAFYCGAFEGVMYEPGSRLVDEPGMRVHFVPYGGVDDSLIMPANQWIAPPPGRYKYWVEGDGWISPSGFVMQFVEIPFDKRGQGSAIFRPVVPAGDVCVSDEVELPQGLLLRLVHTESHNRQTATLGEMSRQVILNKGSQCVQMPEGRVLAAWFDSRNGEYLAISKPFEVTKELPAVIHPTLPANSRSHILAVLERPHPVRSQGEYDVRLSVRTAGGSPLPPDLKIPTAERIYAVWYGLDGKLATLEATSPSVRLESQEIVLRPGKVERLGARLQPLPKLSINFDLPPGLRDATGELEIVELPARELVESRHLSPGNQQMTLERVPAGHLEVSLSVPPWRFIKQVDLSDGLDRELFFQPDPIEVRGTVFHGEKEHPATVTFSVDPAISEGRLAIESDSSGNYEALFFRDGYFAVEVRLAGKRMRPYRHFLTKAVSATPRLDFRLPANEFVVKVVDSTTEEGIAYAQVTASNRAKDPGGQHRTERHQADSEGLVPLSPQTRGKLQLFAEAEGYAPSEGLQVEVAANDGHREFQIKLMPIRDASQLTVLLPNGDPARSAEVLALSSLNDPRPLWRGTVKDDGTAELPEVVAGAIVAVRHPETAFLLRRFDGFEDQTTWVLEEKSRRFSVMVQNSWGDPLPWSAISLKLDGVALHGFLLQWLVQSSATNSDGVWRPDNLPARPFQLAAWSPGSQPTVEAFPDSLASTIPYPREGLITVEAVN